MDFMLEELERMGVNASTSDNETEIDEADIKRWQELFSLTYSTARDNIQQYRADLSRQKISDDLWLEIQTSKEAQGYDKEAYEYYLFNRPKAKENTTTAPSTSTSMSAISNTQSLRGLILDGPLNTPEKVRDIAGLKTKPTIITAESEETSKNFCYITAEDEERIRQALADRGIAFNPYFISINIAAKDVSSSAAPKLGVDVTMPQHRPSTLDLVVQQDQYPVLYFFYGTLTQPEILERVLGKFDVDILDLREAYVFGGGIRSWGKYRALVDSSLDSRVDGHAFMIASEDQERELRLYETNMYEVVRCDIWLAGNVEPVNGLTFRFAG